MIRKPPRTCLATTQIDRLPQGNESCRTATQVGLLHTPADSVPSTHPHEVHTVTPPLAPSQPPNWYPFSPPPTSASSTSGRASIHGLPTTRQVGFRCLTSPMASFSVHTSSPPR